MQGERAQSQAKLAAMERRLTLAVRTAEAATGEGEGGRRIEGAEGWERWLDSRTCIVAVCVACKYTYVHKAALEGDGTSVVVVVLVVMAIASCFAMERLRLLQVGHLQSEGV